MVRTGSVTDTVAWSSSNTSAATIVSSGVQAGLAAGVAPGTANLIAVLTTASGSISGFTSLTVIEAPVTLMAITVKPTSSRIATGTAEQLLATGRLLRRIAQGFDRIGELDQPVSGHRNDLPGWSGDRRQSGHGHCPSPDRLRVRFGIRFEPFDRTSCRGNAHQHGHGSGQRGYPDFGCDQSQRRQPGHRREAAVYLDGQLLRWKPAGCHRGRGHQLEFHGIRQSRPSNASGTGAGLATAVSAGSTQISANYQGMTATTSVQVTAARSRIGGHYSSDGELRQGDPRSSSG